MGAAKAVGTIFILGTVIFVVYYFIMGRGTSGISSSIKNLFNLSGSTTTTTTTPTFTSRFKDSSRLQGGSNNKSDSGSGTAMPELIPRLSGTRPGMSKIPDAARKVITPDITSAPGSTNTTPITTPSSGAGPITPSPKPKEKSLLCRFTGLGC